jgi:shikimate dehydrogenase
MIEFPQPMTKCTMYFIGVTTGSSSIMRLFPRWMEAINRADVSIKGVDFKMYDNPMNYRRCVELIKCDPVSLGALVTTHKISLLAACRDLFDELDHYAELCGEVSCISKQGSRLVGRAKDPITSGLSLQSIIGDSYFGRSGGHVLCFGGGGSATALIMHLATRKEAADRPERFIVVNRSQERLDGIRRLVGQLGSDIEFELICQIDPAANDRLMGRLPAGSIVINATGMGKDLPGSPITSEGRFPKNGIAWELNYRGELEFLHQAMRQRESAGLRVEDGWTYFLHGWTQVITEVLHIEMSRDLFKRLETIAEGLSSARPIESYAPAPLAVERRE